MTNNKLVVVIMGQNCEKFLPMCLESVKDADDIIYCDGGSKDKSIDIAMEYNAGVLQNPYDQEDRQMNGKQRNFYLNYIKQKYPNDWCLVLDADEVVEDLGKLVSFIQEATPGLYSPKMRHFIGNLGNEDLTAPEHFCLNRLFKISEAGNYPEVEHPVLQFKKHEHDDLYYYGNIPAVVIWHLGYIHGLFDIKRKYESHSKKSNMHTPEYLYSWNMSHCLGTYPTKQVNPIEIPKIILDYFHIERDGFYFANRQINVNNFLMVKDWMAYYNPTSVLDLGCGLGNYGCVFNKFYGVKYTGIDISNFAIKNNLYKLDLKQGDIITYKDANRYDLVLVLDILEHLDEKDLDKTLDNIKNLGNDFIFSLPFIGDSNLYKDTTHRIFKDKEWWTKKLEQYYQIRESPENWAFHEQILIGKRANIVNQNSMISPVNTEDTAQINVPQE